MNLTLEVIIIFISSIPLFASALLLYKQYLLYPDFVLGIMALAWFNYAVYNFMSAISYLFLSKDIFILRSLLLPIFLILIEIALSYIGDNQLHPIRFPLVTVLAAAVTYSIFLPNSVNDFTFENGDQSFFIGGVFRIVTIIGIIYAIIVYSYYNIKIYYYSTPELRYWAKMNFLGTIIIGPVAFLTFLTKLNRVIPGLTELVFGIGTLITAAAFSKKPQLLYLLPFKAMKLLVIKEGAGLAIYTHHWTGEDYDVKAPLFASAIESINAFAKIAIQQGNITEVKLEEAILMIHIPKNQGLYYALLATKSSYILKSGLERFSSIFYLTYHSELQSPYLIETSAMERAIDIIDICFPYIPK